MSTVQSLTSTYYASFVSDHGSADCITRICNIRATKIKIPKSIFKKYPKHIFLAMSIRDSKHILRSGAIELQEDEEFLFGDIDLAFQIKYSHYMRRKYNFLNMFLQRRRTYNNKVVAGHKTVAFAIVDLSWVIQRMNKETLRLSTKSKDSPYSVINFSQFNSVPFSDILMISNIPKDTSHIDVHNSSQSGSDNELTSPEKKQKKKMNDKQRRTLTKVLGKLKIADELKESILSLADKQNNEKEGYDIDPFESADSLDESHSYRTQSSYTPKVQPHFRDSGSNSSAVTSVDSYINESNKPEISEDDNGDQNSRKRVSVSGGSELFISSSPNNPQIQIRNDVQFLENIRLTQNEDTLACLTQTKHEFNYFILMLEDTFSDLNVARALRTSFGQKLILVRDPGSINQVFTTLFSCVQNQINAHKNILKLKICIFGRDECLTIFIQELVKFNMPRLYEILENTQILFAPIVLDKFSNYLCNLSQTYSSIFNCEEWLQSFSNPIANSSTIISKIFKYINSNTKSQPMPMSEICLKISNPTSEDMSASQIVLPFFMYVSVGYINVDLKVCEDLPTIQSNYKIQVKPSLKESRKTKIKNLLQSRQSYSADDQRMMIDYWLVSPQVVSKETEKIVRSDKKEIKLSAKGDYEIATIYRNNFILDPHSKQISSDNLNIIISKSRSANDQSSKSKKKEKISTSVINDITHIVCTSKGCFVNVDIDGQVWDSIKYFSVSPKSSSNIKFLPFGIPSI